MAPPPLRPSFSKGRSETEIFVSGAMDRINSSDSVAESCLRHFSTDIVSPRSSSILNWRPPRWPYRSAVSKRGEVSFWHRVRTIDAVHRPADENLGLTTTCRERGPQRRRRHANVFAATRARLHLEGATSSPVKPRSDSAGCRQRGVSRDRICSRPCCYWRPPLRRLPGCGHSRTRRTRR